MRKMVFRMFAVGTALGSATMASAQVPPTVGQTTPQPVQPGADTTGVQTIDSTAAQTHDANDDIVVTARREAENLQNVPVSVQVISGDTIKKLAINDASELSKLAPGLTLSASNDSAGQKVVLRGVTWKPGSGTPATPIYFNEAPFDPANSIQSIFDIDQIEVLRGPQGTTRGAPSISGAITITTRRPDLSEIGGYVQSQYGSGHHYDVQGAVSVPIIRDVLAVRASADIQGSDYNRVYSVHNDLGPDYKSRVYRLSVLFKPTDTITLNAMYQYRDDHIRSYFQVSGPGSPGAASAGIPANFNGPALTDLDMRSVQDAPSYASKQVQYITLNASWNVLGQTLSYNFGKQIDTSPAARAALDTANFLPGYEAVQYVGGNGPPLFQTNEVRLSSIHSEDRPFDYDLGWFSKHSGGPITAINPVYLTGAFGAPGTAPGVVTTPNPRYVLTANANIRLAQYFDSFYGSVRFYLDSKTELDGGISILRDRVPVTVDITTSAASTVALSQAALGGLPCPGIPGVFSTGLVNSTYAGYCDFNIPAGAGNFSQANNDKYSDALYNFSLSHKFTDDVLVYGTTGTSFRTGLPAIANTGLPGNLLTPLPERATSYEVGAKISLGRRLRIDGDIYQINYDNQLTTFQGIQYFNTTSNSVALTSTAFYRNVNARVRGAELEIDAKPIDYLSLGANLSYSKIKSRGGIVPCNVGPAITAANPINFCSSPVGQTLNTQAPFQATVNGSYEQPVTNDLDGYLRFNVNYQGHNPNFGNYPVNGTFRETRAYEIVDLFAGIAAHRGAWELGVYAKNVFDRRIETDRALLLNNIYAPYTAAATGYDQVAVTAPREIGVTLRASFGSR